MSIWNSDDDEILINFVGQHEVLYNTKFKYYRNTQMKQKLWIEIAETLNRTDVDCCKRWSYVRDYYIRRKGKPTIGTSGAAAKKRATLLTFLDSVVPLCNKSFTKQENQSDESNENMELPLDYCSETTPSHFLEMQEYGNYENSNERVSINEDDIPNDTESNGGSKTIMGDAHVHQRKRPKPEDELDENDHFFCSMAKIVKKLPRHDQAHLRMQIGSLIGNAELRYLSNGVAPSSEYTSVPSKWET
ncbi:hypothetical protein O0L34_g4879 [Tuta absoluta]|nr:hypothetical protein O0L34_g4879 [Tuta absoluta]